MKIYSILVVTLLFFSKSTFGQVQDSSLVIGKNAFVLVKDPAIQSDLKSSLIGFLKFKNNGSATNPYVDSLYLKENIEPFVWYIGVEDRFIKDSIYLKPEVIAVMPTEDSGFVIKIAYLGTSPKTQQTKLELLITLVAKKGNDRYYFYNAIERNTKFWNKKRVGTIQYIYPNFLDPEKAEKMNAFNINFAKKFGVSPLNITYYKSEDPEQLFKMMGYDYIPNMYYSTSGGLAEAWHNTLFAGNNSELYEHEAVHFYTSSLFPQRSRIVDEGYATYIGGSGGVSIDKLAILAREYLKNNPNKDRMLLATDFKIRLDGGIPLTYILSGLVCKDIEEKYGIKGISRLFSPDEGDDYFMNLKKISQIDKVNFNKYINTLLDKY